MPTALDLINGKEYANAWSISPNLTVYEAIRLMASKDIGALIVKNGEKVEGLITERDYTRKIILAGRSSIATLVSDVMTTDVAYVEPSESVENCMALMTYSRLRYLLVIEEGVLLGIISIGDIVKALISDKQFLIDELVKYVTGSQTLRSGFEG